MRVAGFGFRAGADEGALLGALAAAGGGAGLTLLATAADRAEAPALRALAARLALPLRPVPLSDIAATKGAAPSPRAPARYGHRSLAEAAALAAAGPGARLIARRAVSPCGRATCAIALSPEGPPG